MSENSPTVVPIPTPASPVAADLAAQITPPLRLNIEAQKSAIVASVTPFVLVWALKLAWGWLMTSLLPLIVLAGTNAILDRFGVMSLADLAAQILKHNTARGRSTHPTVAKLAADGIH